MSVCMSVKCSDCNQSIQGTPFREGLRMTLDEAPAWLTLHFWLCTGCHDSLPEPGSRRQLALAQMYQRTRGECELSIFNTDTQPAGTPRVATRGLNGPITLTCTKKEAEQALADAASGAKVQVGLEPDVELGREPGRLSYHRHRITVSGVTLGYTQTWGVPVDEILAALKADLAA